MPNSTVSPHKLGTSRQTTGHRPLTTDHSPNLPVRLIFVPWLIPAWAQAQVWGNLILIRRGVAVTERLLAHELAHVVQWRTLGLIPFVCQYLVGLIRFGYWDHPLEQEARAAEHQDFYRGWARQILPPTS